MSHNECMERHGAIICLSISELLSQSGPWGGCRATQRVCASVIIEIPLHWNRNKSWVFFENGLRRGILSASEISRSENESLLKRPACPLQWDTMATTDNLWRQVLPLQTAHILLVHFRDDKLKSRIIAISRRFEPHSGLELAPTITTPMFLGFRMNAATLQKDAPFGKHRKPPPPPHQLTSFPCHVTGWVELHTQSSVPVPLCISSATNVVRPERKYSQKEVKSLRRHHIVFLAFTVNKILIFLSFVDRKSWKHLYKIFIRNAFSILAFQRPVSFQPDNPPHNTK